MSGDDFAKVIGKDSKVLDLVKGQIDAAGELKETNHELYRNARLLEGVARQILYTDKAENFEHVKGESKHIIRDLAHLKDEDIRIKKLGEKVISRFQSHRLTIKKDGDGKMSQTIRVLTVGKDEIVRDEQRMIDIVENNVHSIKMALDLLEKVIDLDFDEKNHALAYETVKHAQIHIKHVYLTAQAIIQLEARINQEESELAKGFESISMAA